MGSMGIPPLTMSNHEVIIEPLLQLTDSNPINQFDEGGECLVGLPISYKCHLFGAAPAAAQV